MCFVQLWGSCGQAMPNLTLRGFTVAPSHWASSKHTGFP